MKKKILLIVAVLLLVVDAIIAGLFWKNYTYHMADVDEWAIALFIGSIIVIGGVVVIIHCLKGQENLLPKIVIVASGLFIVITFGYKIYNDSVHYKLEIEDVADIRTSEKRLEGEEIKSFVENFNSAKFIKRNYSCAVEGTPDKTITVILSDEERISINKFGEQLAVQVSGRSYGDSCYWMEQKDISKLFE